MCLLKIPYIVTMLPFWHYVIFLKQFYFFIYYDLCHIESNNLVQKPIGAFLI